MVAIGIDLGSVFSCIGVFQHCTLQTSYVPVTNSKYLWPFKVASNAGDQLNIDENLQRDHTEITAVVLKELKESAEDYLGQSVTEAVITVPAFFTDAQRQATMDAGLIAGIYVLAIINNSTAAALAYRLTSRQTGEDNVLIFNFDGRTFDVLVLTFDESARFDVRAMAIDSALPVTFDNRLVTHMASEFRFQYKKDLSSSTIALGRLRTAAELVKRSLSSVSEITIAIDELFEGQDFITRITRDMFNELCADLFQQILNPVEKALALANLDKNQLDDIVLVGGSTRFPNIQNVLQDFFGVKGFNMTNSPDEVVAKGAAVLAAILSSDRKSAITDDLVQTLGVSEIVAPPSLGIETAGGVMAKIIKRNCLTPRKQMKKLLVIMLVVLLVVMLVILVVLAFLEMLAFMDVLVAMMVAGIVTVAALTAAIATSDAKITVAASAAATQ